MKTKLQVGDVIKIFNPLGNKTTTITKVEGNKAYSRFRNFNAKIHYRGQVYEYGKKLSRVYNNDYFLVPSEVVLDE